MRGLPPYRRSRDGGPRVIAARVHARAAAMRALVDGWLWNSTSTRRDGRSSARFCAASRFIALTNASALRVIVQRIAVGAALVRARERVGDRHEHQRDAASRERPAAAAPAMSALPDSPNDDPQRREHAVRDDRTRARPARSRARCADQMSRCTWCASSWARITSISSSEWSASSVSDSRMRRVRADAGERRIRLARAIAQRHSKTPSTARAGALGQRQQPRRRAPGDRAA